VYDTIRNTDKPPNPPVAGAGAEPTAAVRRRLLDALADRLTARGVRCLVALPRRGAPVLYAAPAGRTVCVVAAETAHGWAFLGPGLQTDADDPEHAADRLADPRGGRAPDLRTALSRRPRLRAVA